MLSRLFHRSQNKGHSNDLPVEANCYWPEDLLPTNFPNTRIATYGYDSQVTRFFNGASSQTNILDHGRSLLSALEANRRGDPQRPIIFIVHSLGGLILKDALRRSWQAQSHDKDLRKIYEATTAVVFMGTPHRGSQYASWALILRNIAIASGFDASERILRDLNVDSGILEMLRDEFGKMLREEKFDIYTFQESKGFKGVQGLTARVSLHCPYSRGTIQGLTLLLRLWKMCPQDWMMRENAKIS